MENQTNIKSINKLLYIGIFTLIFCLIILVFKYIGIGLFITKVIRAFIPVFIAIFISFIVEPIVLLFTRWGIKRKYSVLITYFIFVLSIGLILYFTIPVFISQIKVFISNIPSLLNIISELLNGLGWGLNDNSISSSFNDLLMNISSNLINTLGSSFEIIFNVLLGVSGALFLSFDFDRFKEAVKVKIPSKLKKPVVYYFENLLPFIHKYFLGMLIDSILIFIISVIGFTIIGIDYALVISIFIAFTNLIPIIGPYIGGVPAAIVGFSVSTSMGVSAIVVVVLVQFIESNFMQPLILKNVISLHPLEGILGISLFGALFGVIGMILSPILIVSIKLLFLPYNEKIESEIKNV